MLQLTEEERDVCKNNFILMILYNVTVNIDDSVHDEWLDWMINEHIPEVLSTGLFINYKLFRIKSDDEGKTYSIQYFLDSMEKYEKYARDHAPVLQKKHTEKYKDKFAAFRTIMESVEK